MGPGLTRTLRLLGLLEAGRRIELRRRMSEPRVVPEAVILGAQKCGTSSLHYYLVQHPGVVAPLRKEVHYFDLNLARGEAWYRAHFGLAGQPGLSIDSSPYYLFHPVVPARLHALMPGARLVVLLRDPVRRAYSHYWHERDKGRETLPSEDAIAAEPARIDADHARLASGELEVSAAHQHFSYLARGRYTEQLERWLALYPRERLLVLRFEDLARDPSATLQRICGFIGLPYEAGMLDFRHKVHHIVNGNRMRLSGDSTIRLDEQTLRSLTDQGVELNAFELRALAAIDPRRAERGRRPVRPPPPRPRAALPAERRSAFRERREDPPGRSSGCPGCSGSGPRLAARGAGCRATSRPGPTGCRPSR